MLYACEALLVRTSPLCQQGAVHARYLPARPVHVALRCDHAGFAVVPARRLVGRGPCQYLPSTAARRSRARCAPRPDILDAAHASRHTDVVSALPGAGRRPCAPCKRCQLGPPFHEGAAKLPPFKRCHLHKQAPSGAPACLPRMSALAPPHLTRWPRPQVSHPPDPCHTPTSVAAKLDSSPELWPHPRPPLRRPSSPRRSRSCPPPTPLH